MKRLVLVGGGTAHASVLQSFARDPMAGVEITFVTSEPVLACAGMVPGFLAAHYGLDECLIDLRRLADAAGARLIIGAPAGLDPSTRRLRLKDGSSVPYDVLSLDVGATPDLEAIPGAQAHAISIEPSAQFATRWQELVKKARSEGGPRRIVSVGDDAAAVEAIVAARCRFTASQSWEARRRDPFHYTLIAPGGLLAGHAPGIERRARASLADRDVAVIENDPIVEITPSHVRMQSGRMIPCDAAVVSAKLKPPEWIAETGLPRDAAGYLALRPTLQALSDDDVFAAGACATIVAYARPKAGVGANGQGPMLSRQLRRHLRTALLDPLSPQNPWVTFVALGEKSAIAGRGSISAAGYWPWIYKDWMDRRYVRRFNRI